MRFMITIMHRRMPRYISHSFRDIIAEGNRPFEARKSRKNTASNFIFAEKKF